jgi:ATP phosphoribosyltransferase
MKPRDRLRIAMQKSGRLSEASLDLLARCGITFRQSRDRLFCYGETLPVDLLLVRDDDIPGLIREGVCDLGMVGRNVLAEYAAGVPDEAPRELRALGFGYCRLSIAVPQEQAYQAPPDLAGLRIATSYPNLLGAWLQRQGVAASTVVLNGSVEIAPRLGTADVICDLVSTGGTLAANQLREVEVILESEAVLAGAAREPTGERAALLAMLLRRLDGVISVRESKLVMLHAPRTALDAIRRLLPGASTATVLRLEDNDSEVAVQAVCQDAVTWAHLEEMKRLGARSLLVLPLEKALA